MLVAVNEWCILNALTVLSDLAPAAGTDHGGTTEVIKNGQSHVQKMKVILKVCTSPGCI